MKQKIICVFIIMLLLSTFAGALPSTNVFKKSNNVDPTLEERSYTHYVLGEYGTMTTCVPCKYAHRALQYLWQNRTNWDLPFYYITYVYDKNNWSFQRVKSELDLQASPTLFWDGGWRKDIGATDVESAMAKYNASIRAAAARTVKDIDVNLNVTWQGAVNEVPNNNSTDVPVEQIMRWNNSEFKVDVEVICNETDGYNGHLHVQVTEKESEWYKDHYQDPETFEFKDYAYNDDVTFSGVGTWTKTIYWDGCDHNDKDSPPRYFNHVKQDNIMVFATIFDEDNNNYADDATGFSAGEGTDPKLYDIYFGTNQTPPKIYSNISQTKYINYTNLEFNTTYYWKIDTWNAQGVPVYGDIWWFTTRGNDAPLEPYNPDPYNGSIDQPIKINLSWDCNDPNWDNVTYDVYFGDHPTNLSKRSSNQTESWWNASLLKFQRPYYWQIIAWDYYGYETVGPVWHFTTEPNYPPNPAVDPKPSNGDPAVPKEGVVLEWNGSDPNIGDTLFYDVYFDDVNPPTNQETNQSENWWIIPYTLSNYTTYYWRIDTWDKNGEFAQGNNWSFTTGDNLPPSNPIITGPAEGVTNTDYDFTFLSTDPENHDIMYRVRWGDGKIQVTDYLASGTAATLNHSWSTPGDKVIKATVIDEHGAESGEAQHTIVIKYKSRVVNLNIFEWLFERFIRNFPILKHLLELY